MPVNSFADYPLTWRPVLSRKSGTVYLELAGRLEDDILAGRLKPGVKLPPQRELADYLDIDFTTVTRAYAVCREKGLIYGVVGRGTFVASDVPRDPSRKVVELGVVEAFPEIGADELVAAARKVLARGDVGRLFDYTARDGRSRPRAAALAWLKREGLYPSADCTAIFPGTQSALSVALLSLFRPGDRLGVDPFTYANLIELAYLAHVKLIPVKGDADGMLPEALSAAAEKDRLKGVYLMPTAANPTGVSLPDERRRALANVCRIRDLIILEDSSALWPDERKQEGFFALAPERTIHFAGSTRFIASGLRVTFVAFPERYGAKLLKGLHHLVIKASALEAEILAEVILSGGAERILARKRKACKEANKVFDAVFGGTGRGFFRTLPLPGTTGRGAEIEARLLEAGVRVCHSDRFAVTRGAGESFLRLSVSSAPNLADLRKALHQVSVPLVKLNLALKG